MLKVKDFHNNYNYLFELKCKPSSEFDEKTKKKQYTESIIQVSIKDNSKVELSKKNEDCDDDTDCEYLQNKLRKHINIYNNFYFYNQDKMKNDDAYISNCMEDKTCKEKLTFKNELAFFNQLSDTKVYSIEIRVGKDIFHIYNVTNVIFNNDVSFIGLIIQDKKISFYINTSVFTFERQSDEEIIAEDEPFTINENGGCHVILYSFAFYQTAVCESDISAFKLYNNYYLYGTNKIQEDNNMLENANQQLKKKLGI